MRYIPEVTENENVVGIDVNIKSTICSVCQTAKPMTMTGSLLLILRTQTPYGQSSSCRKEYQRKLDTLRTKIHKSNQQLISKCMQGFAETGVNIIAMEDLDNGFRKIICQRRI